MSNYDSQKAKCPFYLGGDNYKIKCEGVEKENNIHIVFGNSKKKQLRFKEKCCGNYEKCRVYKMLFDKYQ